MSHYNLQNSDKVLVEGIAHLLRDEVAGWAENSEYGVPNVWPKSPPASVEEEYPRAVVDIIAGDDTELSTELDVRLREAIVRVVVFSDTSGDVFDLTDAVDDVVPKHFDSLNSEGNPYTGDWSYRELDGFAETNEVGETEGKLRYSRYKDFIFETVRVKE